MEMHLQNTISYNASVAVVFVPKVREQKMGIHEQHFFCVGLHRSSLAKINVYGTAKKRQKRGRDGVFSIYLDRDATFLAHYV